MDAAAITKRLEEAGISVGWAETVVVDLANDPPQSASLRAIAAEEAGRIVEGAGAAMLACRARRGVIAVRDAASHKSIEGALSAAGAKSLTAVRLPSVWPIVGIDRDLDCHYAWVLDGERLLDLEAAAFGRARAPRRVTVVGEVARPGVFAVGANGATVEALVEAAGGAVAEADAWVAIDGGAYGGVPVDREAAVRSGLLLIVPAAHPISARARVSIADQLRRAASACEGCRVCSDVCPPALDGMELAPHSIVALMVAGTDRGTTISGAAACIECGVCDAACPSGISPATIVRAVKARLPQELAPRSRGEAHPDRAGRRMSIELLMLRAGLA